MRGVFLHILGDALGSVVVVISALVIMFCEGDWKYKVDPAMSLLMVMLIMSTTIPLCWYHGGCGGSWGRGGGVCEAREGDWKVVWCKA